MSRNDTEPPEWDCRLCTRPDNTEEVCGYCGNPKEANASFPRSRRKDVPAASPCACAPTCVEDSSPGSSPRS
ncbi:hypothetical protein [Streptomonospora litoralis]|uniref:Uncharacterized protein n=1 Tax=Streptomonospora litoralis TaxID=2498135 RepID=A0A4P6PZB1_9ACTN|nr:hypothetical protein [Streptomonospora litoralis]QBI52241.1 hypothetical protein EKD16_02125 [Streptomonospora litoralis]